MPSLPTPVEVANRLGYLIAGIVNSGKPLKGEDILPILTEWQAAIARQARDETLAMGDKALKLALDNCGRRLRDRFAVSPATEGE